MSISYSETYVCWGCQVNTTHEYGYCSECIFEEEGNIGETENDLFLCRGCEQLSFDSCDYCNEYIDGEECEYCIEGC